MADLSQNLIDLVNEYYDTGTRPKTEIMKEAMKTLKKHFDIVHHKKEEKK